MEFGFSQQMLPAIKHVAGDTFCLSTRQRSISSCQGHHIKLLQLETPALLTLQTLATNSPNSPYLPVDYKVWSVMQQRVYNCRMMSSVDGLKQRLLKVWNSLQQNVIDAAINEWRKSD